MDLNYNKKVNYKLIIIGLFLFISILFFGDFGNQIMVNTVAITVLVAFLWLTESLPMGITSLLPIILFPLFGVLNGKVISGAYINYVVFLFIGGIILALAIEKHELHKRMALKILSYTGGSLFKIMLGFMLCSSFLSMWISNASATMIMIPIAISVVTVLNKQIGEEYLKKYNMRLFLAIAYASTMGGITTLVGTPPNLAYLRISEILYPNIPEISFAKWMLITIPLGIIMFICVLLILYSTGKPKLETEINFNKKYFKEKYKALGKATKNQKRVLVVFLITVFLWLFRTELTLGNFTIPGWSNLFKNPHFFNDGTVAIFIAFLLFIIPSSQKEEALVTWNITNKVPWHIVFLLGGGFAIAKAFTASGLSTYLGQQLTGISSFSDIGIIATLVTGITFLTEFTSNTGTTEILLPVIGGLATAIKLNPLILMISVTLASSMAFMLPVATAPNALVFGTGRIKMLEMLKVGFILNFFAIIFITLIMSFWIGWVLDINLHDFPEWAQTGK